MVRKKFLRGKWRTYSKLGKGRKNKQKYRKAKGRHNKIREKRKGNPKRAEIGYKKNKQIKTEVVIYTPSQIKDISKGTKVIIGNVGQKKKLELIKKAEEKSIEITNINTKKFLKKIKRKREEKEKEKKAREEKKKKEIKKTEKKETKKKENKDDKKIKEGKDKKDEIEQEKRTSS